MKRLAALTLAALPLASLFMRAQAPACDMGGYHALPGLSASNGAGGLTVTWDAERDRDVRLRLGIDAGTPTIRDLAIRRKGSAWTRLAANAQPEFRVVAGFRRMSNQQLQPLNGLGVAITAAIVDEKKWDAFWDAPLDLNPQVGRGGNPPPAAGVGNQPGLPRNADEITRATATYRADRCEVKTDGARLEITFPGLQLGPFAGRLQFTVYRGTGLVRMEAIAKTDRPSVAYKYDAGLTKLGIDPASRLVWRDTSNTWQSYRFGGSANESETPIKASNRVLIAERGASQSPGSLAVFPPPHTFFWAREVATNLGYVWYRKDGAGSFSFGVRQAEREETPQYDANFALYSARPGTWQRMPVYFYASADAAQAALDPVLALTHGDRYKPLPGYQVMNHHYHMDLGERLLAAGLDAEVPDLQALKALGITIVSQIDSIVAGGGRGAARISPLAVTKASVEGALRHSDTDFIVMPNQEYYGSPLGGHTDLLFSHPVYWTQGRAPGQPLVDRSGSDAKSGSDPAVYHIGSADDLMEMARREDILISMPHPRTKGSTGFPDAVKDTAAFRDPHYQGVGFRWGMGLDLSERRLCERRCLALLDDMSNWTADRPGPPKYILSISEVRHQAPGDDIYASAPVSYVKLDRLPAPQDVSPLVQALMRGDYFVTTGEVLIPSYAVGGSGGQRTIDADVEWTFPLDFVEVVWGDGVNTGGLIVPATDQPPMGRHHFSIPFDAAGKKWVRFAAWDSAGNGALVQPIKFTP